MTDRIVRIISASPPIEARAEAWTFSEFAAYPNVILLGDPGAGKTHLMRSTASSEGGRFMRAGSFLNKPCPLPDASLFIDALDEKRSHRGDTTVTDAIVRKLFEAAPARVRISCRAQDWLDETDLASLKDYFDERGGVVVLALDKLSQSEILDVLAFKAITDPEAFVRQAVTRGVGHLLRNPQNLVMLCDVVTAKGWPVSRSQLYAEASDLLLEEHNKDRVQTSTGIFSSGELLDTAGAICALRLLSDVDGISTAEGPGTPEMPSYRSISCADVDKVRACLGRRLFETFDPDQVDAVHRTVAEYQSARWLSKRVREGFPFGRVRALYCVDGRPASELRGLNAWLAVTLPEHAEAIIDADPYGVLTYGDVSALSPSLRKYFVGALARLSQSDPWFRNGEWSLPELGDLASPDMVEVFRDILRDESSNFTIRLCVLEALSTGKPLPELRPVMLQILGDSARPFAERNEAFDALVGMGAGDDLSRREMYDGFGVSEADFRLRTNVLTRLYDKPFAMADVGQLISDILASDVETPIGTLWPLEPAMPTSDVLALLDVMPGRGGGAGDDDDGSMRAERRNATEVTYLFDRLLVRALAEAPNEISGERLWGWLGARHKLIKETGMGQRDALAEALQSQADLVLQTVRPAVADLVVDKVRWRFIQQFREATLHVLDEGDLARELVAVTLQCEPGEKQQFLFELSLGLSFRLFGQDPTLFEALSRQAEADETLRPIFERNLSSPIDPWTQKDIQRRLKNAKKVEVTRAKNRSDFARDRETIRAGGHMSWASWLAELYYLRDGHGEVTNPTSRIAAELGEDETAVALEGLMAVTRRSDLPTVDVIADHFAQQKKYFPWWRAIVAGLDEMDRQARPLDDVPLSTFAAALAIGTELLLVPDSRFDPRRWFDHYFQIDSAGANQVYLQLAKGQLAAGATHISALTPLLRDPHLARFHGANARAILELFPNANFGILKEVLQAAMADPHGHASLLALANRVLAGEFTIDDEQRDLWLAAAYLLDDSHAERVRASSPGMIWRLRDLSGNNRFEGRQGSSALDLNKMEFIADFVARHHASCDMPSDGANGSQNAWDAADFVRALVNRMSTHAAAEATAALRRMLANPAFASYADHIRHALANQTVLRTDAEFQQPNWQRAVDALCAGVPASAADLQALTLDHLHDINRKIAGGNTDPYKRFWNEDKHAQPTNPKVEDSCRDSLIELLKPALVPLGVVIEPEGHMAANKRADIVLHVPGPFKVVAELKRDTHEDLWTAIGAQLMRYTTDPETSGYGLFVAFWFGEKRVGTVPRGPGGARPNTAAELEAMLKAVRPAGSENKLGVVVLDVSDVNERFAK